MKTKLVDSSITEQIKKNFTIEIGDTYEFLEHSLDDVNLPKDFNIGFITGVSGSGKSLLLKRFGTEETPTWDSNEAVSSHFKDYNDAVQRLQAVGFNTIPQWLLPYRILSTGQKYRVNLARTIKSNTVMDEFTSYIDRSTALGLCNSLQRYIREHNLKNIVFSGVHKDIIPYLKPDWVYDTCGTLTINSETYELTDLSSGQFERKETYSKTEPVMII